MRKAAVEAEEAGRYAGRKPFEEYATGAPAKAWDFGNVVPNVFLFGWMVLFVGWAHKLNRPRTLGYDAYYPILLV